MCIPVLARPNLSAVALPHPNEHGHFFTQAYTLTIRHHETGKLARWTIPLPEGYGIPEESEVLDALRIGGIPSYNQPQWTDEEFLAAAQNTLDRANQRKEP